MGMNEKIDFWSVAHISIMILIGIVQVRLVKKFIEISFYHKPFSDLHSQTVV